MGSLNIAADTFLRKQHTRLLRLRLIFHIYNKAVHNDLLKIFGEYYFPYYFMQVGA